MANELQKDLISEFPLNLDEIWLKMNIIFSAHLWLRINAVAFSSFSRDW